MAVLVVNLLTFKVSSLSIQFSFCFLVDSEGNEPPCCDIPLHERHPNCFQIDVPPRDPFYSRFNQKCIDFSRSTVGLQNSCKLGL